MTLRSLSLWSFEELRARADALLPGQYQSQAGLPNPRSMGSAGLKYDASDRVAWDQIWTHYCDLALAGGPPHRGTLLEAPTLAEVEFEPAGYQLVCGELVRGVSLAAKRDARPAQTPGWLEVDCSDEDMAAWMHRAVMAENVFCRRRGNGVEVPAAPWFRLAKEVKNIVVALSKTGHYWASHLNDEEKARASAALRATGEGLIEPVSRPEALADPELYRRRAEEVAQALEAETGLPTRPAAALGWVGVRFPDEASAAWHVRLAIASDLLARREEECVYLPVPSTSSPCGIDELRGRWCRLAEAARTAPGPA